MPRVAFQGELGAYSEEAIRSAFGADAEPHPCREFFEVGEAVEGGASEYGLLPIENTLAGSVVPSYDVLASRELTILGEVVIPIHHCVLGCPGSDLAGVVRVLSHPVALAQCTRFLRERPGVEPVAVYDTAGAARQVAAAGEPAVAAIAGRPAAERYGLRILAEEVEDRPDNQTRFLVVASPGRQLPQDVREAAPRKALLVLEAENRPGALLRVLEPFARNLINLSKIESRPGEEPWTYRFFLEVEADRGAPAFEKALSEVRDVTVSSRILGSYPRLSAPIAG